MDALASPLPSAQVAVMNKQCYQINAFSRILKRGIWYLGLASWCYGLFDRGLAVLGKGYFSLLDLIQLSTTCLLFIGWLFLKPE